MKEKLDEFTQGTFETMTPGGSKGSKVEGRSIDEAVQVATSLGYKVLDVTPYEGRWLLVIEED